MSTRSNSQLLHDNGVLLNDILNALGQMSGDISSLNAQMQVNTGEITNLSGLMAQNTSEILTMGGLIANLSSQMTVNTDSINQLGFSLQNIEGNTSILPAVKSCVDETNIKLVDNRDVLVAIDGKLEYTA